jgi:nucleoside diphosphate kinase
MLKQFFEIFVVLLIRYVTEVFTIRINSLSFFFVKEIARHIRPRTLRAIYGKDKMKNAVHCTDLAEDASLEVRKFFIIRNFCSFFQVEYFFRILDN